VALYYHVSWHIINSVAYTVSGLVFQCQGYC
jgi:hypothetical protein